MSTGRGNAKAGGGRYPMVRAEGLGASMVSALGEAASALGGGMVAGDGASPCDLVAVSGAELCRQWREAEYAGAVLVLTEGGGSPAGAMEAGADEAVAAEMFSAMGLASRAQTLEKALVVASMRRKRAGELEDAKLAGAAAEQRAARLVDRVAILESEAWTDPLTGLANRRQLSARLERMFAEAVRYSSDLACVMVDLDGFKALNDESGHREGDACLKRVAMSLAETIRASDVAARYGGDEFVVLMPRTNLAEASRVAKRVAEAFRAEAARMYGDSQGGASRVGMSIGVASVLSAKPLHAEGLIDAADRAMYASKAGGVGRVMVWSGGEAVTAA